MKVDIKIGPTGNECEIRDKETGQNIPATRVELVLDAREIPMLRIDIEADDITVEGKDVNSEIGKVTMLHAKGWAKKNGFKLVPDDGLDVELGRDAQD